MNKLYSSVALFLIGISTSQSYAFSINQGHFLLEGGFYSSTQGKDQHIDIQDLIGDQFNVTDKHDTNGLFGLGYLLTGLTTDRFELDYGIKAFYLAPTQVSGTIVQEDLFTNLAYRYEIRHIPLYAAAKARVKTPSEKVSLTFDAGIGPNFLKTNHYNDWSIDNGITLPDHAFYGKSKTVFSATAGIGVQFNNLFGAVPIEVGYRFFYLGQGDFNRRTDQILTILKTGNNYANALVVSLKV